MYKLERDAPEGARAGGNKNAMAKFAMFESVKDLVEYAKAAEWEPGDRKWCGGVLKKEAIQACEFGRPNDMAAAEKDLAGFEKFLEMPAPRFKTVDDVAGGVPNVPAYLAGHPVNMRRKARVADALAPLTVVIDLTTTCTITEKEVRRKGMATLAFVRAMAAIRPVNLYVTASLGHYGDARDARHGYYAACPVETAPLDMARAVFMLTHTGMARALLNGMCGEAHGMGWDGAWPYTDSDKHKRNLQGSFEALFEGNVMTVGGLQSHDKFKNDARAWLVDTLATYSRKAA